MMEIIMTIISAIRDLWLAMGLEDERGGPIWALLQGERELVDITDFLDGIDNQPWWADYDEERGWLPAIERAVIDVMADAYDVLQAVRGHPLEADMDHLVQDLCEVLDEMIWDYREDPPTHTIEINIRYW